MLDTLLADVFAASPIAVSLKSRIGYLAPEEFPRLLSIYRQYSAQELILHPRTRKEMYSGAVHMDAFALAAAGSPFPVVYNGDLFTAEDIRAFEAAHPETEAVMLGRGAAADPALFRRLRGGAAASREELRQFHEELYEAYRAELGGVNAMRKMKELWHYLSSLFIGADEFAKRSPARRTSINSMTTSPKRSPTCRSGAGNRNQKLPRPKATAAFFQRI